MGLLVDPLVKLTHGQEQQSRHSLTHLRLSSNNVLRSCSNVLRSHNLQQQKSRQLNFKTGVLRAVHSIVPLTCVQAPWVESSAS